MVIVKCYSYAIIIVVFYQPLFMQTKWCSHTRLVVCESFLKYDISSIFVICVTITGLRIFYITLASKRFTAVLMILDILSVEIMWISGVT